MIVVRSTPSDWSGHLLSKQSQFFYIFKRLNGVVKLCPAPLFTDHHRLSSSSFASPFSVGNLCFLFYIFTIDSFIDITHRHINT